MSEGSGRATQKSLCCYDVVGFQTESDRVAFHDYIVRHAHGTATPDGHVEAFGRKLRTNVYRIGVFPDEIAEQAERGEARQDVMDLKQSLEAAGAISAPVRLMEADFLCA